MKDNNKIIEEILTQYSNELGKDFQTYRNHVYRIFTICLTLDNDRQNEEKYAIAAAFHDLGIWTNNTFDYLEPSIALANQYLSSLGKTEDKVEIELMIDMHHKMSKYSGKHEKTVETFRRADWIDVTRGTMRFSLDRTKYVGIVGTYPFLGFHRFLVVQTLKNLFKSPLNPLPMFKK